MAIEKLNEEEAHEEANMIRAEANLERKPGSISPKWIEDMYGSRKDAEDVFNKFIEHTATPEEYDAASQEIDELKRLAQEEPDTAKILYKIGRASFYIGDILIGDLFKRASDFAEENKGKKEEEQIQGFRQELWNKLDDAAAELKRMKDAGARYGKAEVAPRVSKEPRA